VATYYYIPSTGNIDDSNAWSTNAGGPGDTTATESTKQKKKKN